MEDQIREIFEIRDRAVKSKDAKMLLTTQTGEILNSNTEAYITNDSQISTVLFCHNDDQDTYNWIVLVKEEYFFAGKKPHQSYLVYKIHSTDEGLKIFDIAW